MTNLCIINSCTCVVLEHFIFQGILNKPKYIKAVHNYLKDANHSAKLPKLDIKYID